MQCNIIINKVFIHNIFQHFHYSLNYRVLFLISCCRIELILLHTTLRYVHHRLHCTAPSTEHHIKWKQMYAKWELQQYLWCRMCKSRLMDGNMDKEGGWWHEVPHVIRKIQVSIPCKEAKWIINCITKLAPPNEVSHINYLYTFLKLICFPYALV